jgi:hypothetical protein
MAENREGPTAVTLVCCDGCRYLEFDNWGAKCLLGYRTPTYNGPRPIGGGAPVLMNLGQPDPKCPVCRPVARPRPYCKCPACRAARCRRYNLVRPLNPLPRAKS